MLRDLLQRDSPAILSQVKIFSILSDSALLFLCRAAALRYFDPVQNTCKQTQPNILQYNISMRIICGQSYWFSIERKSCLKILDYYLSIRAILGVIFPHPLRSYLRMTSPLIHLDHSSLLPGSGAPRQMCLHNFTGRLGRQPYRTEANDKYKMFIGRYGFLLQIHISYRWGNVHI